MFKADDEPEDEPGHEEGQDSNYVLLLCLCICICVCVFKFGATMFVEVCIETLFKLYVAACFR